MLRKANWDKTLQKSFKFSDYHKSIRKQIQPSCRKNLSTSFCVRLISWKQRNLDIRANIPKSCRKPVVRLLYATKSAFTALYCSEFMLGMRTCLPCHIPDRRSHNANWIWPDLAFSFVSKRSGNEIKCHEQKICHIVVQWFAEDYSILNANSIKLQWKRWAGAPSTVPQPPNLYHCLVASLGVCPRSIYEKFSLPTLISILYHPIFFITNI